MRRITVGLSFLVVLLVSLAVGLGFTAGAIAQEGTPPPEEEFEVPEGITFESLGYGTAEVPPGGPTDIGLFRIGFESGAVLELEEESTAALAYVEEGELSVTMEGPMTVLRAAEEGEPFPTETEDFAAGETFEVAAGDSAIFPVDVAGEVSNEGDEAASVLVADVGPPQEEDGPPEAATPSPVASSGTETIAVDIADFSFSPDTLEIPVGTTVTWTNQDTAPHTATASDGTFDSGSLDQGDDYSFTFDEAGTYEYICEFHPGMQGTIVVS